MQNSISTILYSVHIYQFVCWGLSSRSVIWTVLVIKVYLITILAFDCPVSHVSIVYGAERHLVSDIVERIRYWISCGVVQLQTLAVKICCNMSLMDSQRSAIAETGILDSVFRESLFSPSFVSYFMVSS